MPRHRSSRDPRERLQAEKQPKIVMLDKDFAGVRKGQMLFVATPQIVADYIRAIPFGETRSIDFMRRDLARRRKCDASCPVSTAIFIRLAAEAALRDLAEGISTAEVIPFWRVLSSNDKISRRLDVNGAWIDEQRSAEAVSGGAG